MSGYTYTCRRCSTTVASDTELDGAVYCPKCKREVETEEAIFGRTEPEQEEPNVCGADITTGGADPYGTSCDLKPGHAGPHEGPGWFGEGREQWEGGGYCAGDPLPVRNHRHLP